MVNFIQILLFVHKSKCFFARTNVTDFYKIRLGDVNLVYMLCVDRSSSPPPLMPAVLSKGVELDANTKAKAKFGVLFSAYLQWVTIYTCAQVRAGCCFAAPLHWSHISTRRTLHMVSTDLALALQLPSRHAPGIVRSSLRAAAAGLKTLARSLDRQRPRRTPGCWAAARRRQARCWRPQWR